MAVESKETSTEPVTSVSPTPAKKISPGSYSRLKIKAASTITGIQNKESYLKKICRKFRVLPKEIAYIGDDVNDIEISKLVGLSASPLDGVVRLKKNVDYVCRNKGGNGVFREFADLIIISRGR